MNIRDYNNSLIETVNLFKRGFKGDKFDLTVSIKEQLRLFFFYNFHNHPIPNTFVMRLLSTCTFILSFLMS